MKTRGAGGKGMPFDEGFVQGGKGGGEFSRRGGLLSTSFSGDSLSCIDRVIAMKSVIIMRCDVERCLHCDSKVVIRVSFCDLS